MRLSLAREVLKQLHGAAPQLLGEVHVEGLRVVAARELPLLVVGAGLPVLNQLGQLCQMFQRVVQVLPAERRETRYRDGAAALATSRRPA